MKPNQLDEYIRNFSDKFTLWITQYNNIDHLLNQDFLDDSTDVSSGKYMAGTLMSSPYADRSSIQLSLTLSSCLRTDEYGYRGCDYVDYSGFTVDNEKGTVLMPKRQDK